MEKLPHILVVDDDREIRDLLADFLRKHEYEVETARDGKSMRERLAAARYDLVVLDIMMPGEDGLTLCRDLRANSTLPVILLTALGEETERIVGLEMGADDYLAKPFNPRELLARIKAVLRRTGLSAHRSGESDAHSTLVFNEWRIALAQRELLSPTGETVPLTSGEFDLLVALAEHPQRVLSRDQLLDLTKGRDALPFDRSIDVQLSRLRKKIEPDAKPARIIKTIRGGGYLFSPEVIKE
ncbi:MAG: response regulator [Gammaproteobacteria bacterium]|nr:response regulator [Gammaproteobacteria bacterium]